jgi:predicted dehydrogenase
MFEGGIIKDGTVTALADINPDKIDAVKARLTRDDVAYFEDYKEMIDSGLVDAIMIETPHYFHPEIAIYALERGIHVLCDKPAGVYTKQVKEMNAAAERSSAIFGMMFNQRTIDVYQKMRKMIADGELGEIQRVVFIITDWYRTQFYYDSGSWRATWDGEGGGVLINQCPHQLDLISWILGEQPSAVNGFCKYGRWHDIEVEDEVTAYLEYAGGATGVFITTTGEAPGTNRLEISGTLGKLVCDNGELTFYKNVADSIEYSKSARDGFSAPKCEAVKIECDRNAPQHAGIINNFISAILGREELFSTGISGIRGVELMNAIELSGWRGGARVTLPIDDDEYLEELTEKRKRSRIKNVKDIGAVSTEGSY